MTISSSDIKEVNLGLHKLRHSLHFRNSGRMESRTNKITTSTHVLINKGDRKNSHSTLREVRLIFAIASARVSAEGADVSTSSCG